MNSIAERLIYTSIDDARSSIAAEARPAVIREAISLERRRHAPRATMLKMLAGRLKKLEGVPE